MSRRTTHRVLVLVGVYLVASVAAALWVRGAIREAAWSVMESTAQLVGYEIASAVHDRMEADLSSEARDRQLLSSVVELCRRSTIVRYATVVGRGGAVLATNDPRGSRHTLPPPGELFGDDPRLRVRSVEADTLSAGQFIVDFPLGDGGRIDAYVSMVLTSEALATLYRKGYVTVVAVMIGAVLLLAAMALALHLQFRRRQRVMVEMLDRLARGDMSPPSLGPGGPAVAPALAAVERIGRRLHDSDVRSTEAQQRLALLGEVLDVGIVVFRPDGRPDFVGARARRLLDGARDGLDQVAQAIPSATSSAFSLDLRLDSGDIRQIGCTLLPIGGDRRSGTVVQLRDTGQVEVLERDLMEAVRLRSLHRLFIGVTHDLKAPINAMVLNIEALKLGLPRLRAVDEEAADQHEEGLSALAEELESLRRGLASLLAQTAPPAHRIEQFDLAETVRDTVELLSAQARQQRIRVELTTTPAAVPIRGDRDAVRQAIVNVLINALEAMPEGGELDVRVGAVGDRAEVTIRDTGPGVPASVRDRLFDMHVSTKATGTGIGLYLARSTLTAHGGTLELTATSPEGTAFLLGLPRMRGDDAHA